MQIFMTSFSGAKASAGKLVHMKVVDDKLRINDVPSSAVEMAVKEKVKRNYLLAEYLCAGSCLWNVSKLNMLMIFTSVNQ